MAAQSRGSVKVLVQPEKDSLLAIATEERSSRSVRTWKRRLACLDRDNAGRGVTADRRTLDVAGLPTDELETASFPWTWPISAADLRARLATHSAFVMMDADQREHRLGAAAAIVTAEAERRVPRRCRLARRPAACDGNRSRRGNKAGSARRGPDGDAGRRLAR